MALGYKHDIILFNFHIIDLFEPWKKKLTRLGWFLLKLEDGSLDLQALLRDFLNLSIDLCTLVEGLKLDVLGLVKTVATPEEAELRHRFESRLGCVLDVIWN